MTFDPFEPLFEDTLEVDKGDGGLPDEIDISSKLREQVANEPTYEDLNETS